MSRKIKETTAVFHVPPKMVQSDRGEIIEVILSYADYRTLLHFLADHVDWELLPAYLQDAVDHMLAEEARVEQGDDVATPLLEALANLGIDSGEDVAHQ